MGTSNSRSVNLARFQPLNYHILKKDDLDHHTAPKNRVISQLPNGQIIPQSTHNDIAVQNECTFSGKQTQRFINQAPNDLNPEFSSFFHERVKSEEAYLGDSLSEQGFISSRKAYSDPDIVHGKLNWHRLLQTDRSEKEHIYNSRSLIALSPSQAKIMFRKKTQKLGRSYSCNLPSNLDNIRYTNNKRDVDPFISHKKSLFSKLQSTKGEDVKGFPYILQTPIIPTPDYSTESEGDDSNYESQKACTDSRMKNEAEESMEGKIKHTLSNLDEKETYFKVRDKLENETCSYISTNSKKQTKYEAFNKRLYTGFPGNCVHEYHSDHFTRSQCTTFSENQSNRSLETKSLLENEFPIEIISEASTEKSLVPLETELTSPLVTNTDNKTITLHSAKKPELQICYGKLQCNYTNSGIANNLVNVKRQQKYFIDVEEKVTEENNFSQKYGHDINYSWEEERSNNGRKKKLCENISEFSLTAPRMTENSSISGEEDVKLLVKLKPTLPRRQLHLPHFSPVWRSLCSDNQKSGEESEREEERKINQINRHVAPSRNSRDGYRDSGISPDGVKPALVNFTSKVLFSGSKLEEDIQSATNIKNPLTCSGQHHSLQWTPAQDMDDSEKGSEQREVETFTLSAISIQPKLTFLNKFCTNYNLSGEVREPNRINAPHSGSSKSILHKYFEKHKRSNKKHQENFNSLRNLKKATEFQDTFPVTHSIGNVDSNWNLRFSMPNKIDKAGTSGIWNLELGHFGRRHPGSLFLNNSGKIIQSRKLLSETKKNCLLPSIECDVTCVESYNDLAKDSIVQKDKKTIFLKKKKKFTFQNTLRREKRLRIKTNLINKISEKENFARQEATG